MVPCCAITGILPWKIDQMKFTLHGTTKDSLSLHLLEHPRTSETGGGYLAL